MQKDQSQVEKIAKYYDFIEIQPPALYQDLIDRALEILKHYMKFINV